MGRVIVVGATKGGVGKSVSSYNLSYSLASMGKKVLAVDFDSQANLSTCFGIEATSTVPITIGHLILALIDDEELPDASEYIMSRNGVDFIPSSMVLSAADAKLRLELGAERMLEKILEPLKSRYDYIIVDTCPALGALTINALTAADGVVITVNPQLLAMVGLQEFLKTIKKIKSRINPQLEVEGILLTMCEPRTNLCKVISEQIAETFDGQIRVFESKIPNTVKVGESVYYSEPLLEYAPQTKACRAYMDFGRELIGYESKSA
ncbi:MAG: ParA family protein [Eubacterium sp.]|nr:ParA family protein [Eubacterium sp.]